MLQVQNLHIIDLRNLYDIKQLVPVYNACNMKIEHKQRKIWETI